MGRLFLRRVEGICFSVYVHSFLGSRQRCKLSFNSKKVPMDGRRDTFEPQTAEQLLRLCLPHPEPLITAPRTWY